MEKNIQLPSWFKLSDYNICQDFGIIEWYFNIQLRAYLLLPLHNSHFYKDSYRKNAINDSLNDIKNNWENFLEKRESLLTKNGLAICIHENENKLKNDFSNGVKPLTSHEIRAFYRQELEYHEPNSIISDVIHIDLHLSESQLISAFSEYIHITKKQMLEDSVNIKSRKKYLGVIKRNFTNNDFHRWKANAALAYMDLMLWKNYTGIKKINDEALSETLQIDIDKIRTSVKRIFKRMLTIDYLKAIYSQACAQFNLLNHPINTSQ